MLDWATDREIEMRGTEMLRAPIGVSTETGEPVTPLLQWLLSTLTAWRKEFRSSMLCMQIPSSMVLRLPSVSIEFAPLSSSPISIDATCRSQPPSPFKASLQTYPAHEGRGVAVGRGPRQLRLCVHARYHLAPASRERFQMGARDTRRLRRDAPYRCPSGSKDWALSRPT